MTISGTTTRTEAVGTGLIATAYPTTFKFLADADLKVYHVVTTTGVATLKPLTTHYTVAGAGGATGSVPFLAGHVPAVTDTVLMILDPAVTQTVDYRSGDPFPAETHELALDRLTNQNKRLKELATNSLRLEDTTIAAEQDYDAGDKHVINLGYLQGTEITDPAAPAANQGRIYFRQNTVDASKTDLVVLFQSGSALVIKTEA